MLSWIEVAGQSIAIIAYPGDAAFQKSVVTNRQSAGRAGRFAEVNVACLIAPELISTVPLLLISTSDVASGSIVGNQLEAVSQLQMSRIIPNSGLCHCVFGGDPGDEK